MKSHFLIAIMLVIAVSCAKTSVQEIDGSALSTKFRSDEVYVAYIAEGRSKPLTMKFCPIANGMFTVPLRFSRSIGPLCGKDFEFDRDETDAVRLADGRLAWIVRARTGSDLREFIDINEGRYAPTLLNESNGWQGLSDFAVGLSVSVGKIHVIGTLQGDALSLDGGQDIVRQLVDALPDISVERVVLAESIETSCNAPLGRTGSSLVCKVQ